MQIALFDYQGEFHLITNVEHVHVTAENDPAKYDSEAWSLELEVEHNDTNVTNITLAVDLSDLESIDVKKNFAKTILAGELWTGWDQ